MIKLVQSGTYKLAETRRHTKILYLEEEVFAWVESWKMSEILVLGHELQPVRTLLSMGQYCLYDVDDEPQFSDQLHLELEVGDSVWQGYLLPTGLPNAEHKRSRIIATNEVISVELAEAADADHQATLSEQR